MTTPDLYSYLSNQEFLRVHGDRIPEDLLPRVESLLVSVSKEKYVDLLTEYELLEEENKRLEDDVYYLEKAIKELEDEILELKSELKHVEIE